MSTTTFVIDSRERIMDKLKVDLLKETFIADNINVCTRNLDVGDYILEKDNQVLLIIERKTVPDLCASITDGRHREQKARLLEISDTTKIMYLVEGDVVEDCPNFGRINSYTVFSSILNTVFRDNIPLIKTKNYNETAEFLKTILIRYAKGQPLDQEHSAKTREDVLVESNTRKRGGGSTPKAIFRSAISQIPGISLKLSETIANLWDNISQMIQELKTADSPTEYFREKIKSSAGRRPNLKTVQHLCVFLGINAD